VSSDVLKSHHIRSKRERFGTISFVARNEAHEIIPGVDLVRSG
jgi:hypothetical protein